MRDSPVWDHDRRLFTSFKPRSIPKATCDNSPYRVSHVRMSDGKISPKIWFPGDRAIDIVSTSHSVTAWIESLKQGDPTAAEAIWTRFIARVKAMAHDKIQNVPARFGDHDDLAQNVFAAVFDGIQNDRFRQIDSREDLWQILAMVTARRSADLWRKAVSSSESGESAIVRPDSGANASFADIMGQVSDELLVDSIGLAGSELMQSLEPKLQSVAMLRFKGHSNREIAEQIGRSVKTVERYMKMIREKWDRP